MTIITNLLANMVVLTGHLVIPMNTPALQDYARSALVCRAQVLAPKWHLDGALLASNRITDFHVVARPKGPTAGIQFAGRYVFGSESGDPIGFTDTAYYEGYVFSLTTNTMADLQRWRSSVEQLTRCTNLLSLSKAQRVAVEALRAYGVPFEHMGFRKPRQKEQSRWVDDYDLYVSHSGSIRSSKKVREVSVALPYYRFLWETEKGSCRVHVSGITGTVVHFSFTPRSRLYEGSNELSVGKPANYLELLGLPADTIFVRPFAPGFAPGSYVVLEP